jgi:cytochrome c
MPMRWVLAVVCGTTVIVGAASAQEPDEVKRGETLVTSHCASCHSVRRSGGSPNAEAPPFRTLSRRYPIESLEEALGEGIVAGHSDMPEFKFEAADVGAIVAYLNAIQER